MKTTIFRAIAASLSLTVLPISAFAYSLDYFDLQKDNAADMTQELQEQKLDTLCREQLGMPGGDLLGALRFNLNRCINTLRRQPSLQDRNESRVSRRQLQTVTRSTQAGATMKKRVTSYQSRTYQQRLRTRIEFRSTLPQTKSQQQSSFQSVRASTRISVQQKEQAIQKEEKKRSDYIRQAREACAQLRSQEKSTCIRDKLEELMNEDAEG
ncbi:MAG: hypothetical protein ABIA92_00175 [Patescibacteria group bacterium]